MTFTVHLDKEQTLHPFMNVIFFYLFAEVSVGYDGSVVEQRMIEAVGSELVELRN